MRALSLALGFLTRLPVPYVEVAPGDLARAARLWPVAGLVVALASLGAQIAGAWTVTPLVGAVAAVAASAMMSGGLHLDAWSDSFDGLGVVGDRERRLSAMRDPRAGSLGAAATALLVVLKVALVLACAERGTALLALLAAPVLARAFAVVDACVEPAATPSGLYAALEAEVRARDAVVAVLLGAVIAAAPLVVVPQARAALAVSAVTAWLLGGIWARSWRARIGGSTGDILGAGIEVREVVMLAVLASRLAG